MKKRRMKRWIKATLGIIIAYLICILLAYVVISRVNYFNNNIEKCESNYCEK